MKILIECAGCDARAATPVEARNEVRFRIPTLVVEPPTRQIQIADWKLIDNEPYCPRCAPERES